MLHAKILGFAHPITQAPLRFEDPIPEDMQQRHGFAPLGPADGEVKRKISGLPDAGLRGACEQAGGA